MNRRLGGIALVGVTAVLLAGCAGGGSGEQGSSDGAELRVWLVGTDTPQDARDYLIKTFEDENPGSTLVIEEQQWTGLVDKLTTSLSSNDTPDIVEMGNTQAAAFTSTGALVDLSDIRDALGGDDLLPGFVEAGSVDGALYAAPYYSGARVVFYNTAQAPRQAGVAVPTTLDEYVAGSVTLAPEPPRRLGRLLPRQGLVQRAPVRVGERWRGRRAGRRRHVGRAAVQRRVARGPRQVQELMTKASLAAKDGDETEAWVPFRTEQAATLSAPSWAYWSIVADEDKQPTPLTDALGYFALPGKDGGAAQVFAGGSNIGIAAKSKNVDLAKKALEIILSDEYQSILAENGLVPAKTSLGDQVAAATPELAAIIADAAANAKLTPASPKWADVEAKGLLQDFFVKIAGGGDVASLAEELDTQIESILNG